MSWTLVIYIYAGVFAKGDSVSVTHIPNFKSEAHCAAAGQRQRQRTALCVHQTGVNMTQDEIIEMAIQAGIPSANVPSLAFGRVETGIELLEAFAKLVAARTLMNTDPKSFMSYQEGFEAGQVAEREACAKVCEQEYDNGLVMAPEAPWLAARIRARGQA